MKSMNWTRGQQNSLCAGPEGKNDGLAIQLRKDPCGNYPVTKMACTVVFQ